jgi:DNA-binding CsgD family transcriptional regulator
MMASTPQTIVRAAGRATPAIPLERFEQAVNLLLSPLDGTSQGWWHEVTSTLRAFVDADRAVMMLWQGSARSFYTDALPREMVQEYLDHFAPLDQGMARRDKLNLTVWSRSLLWDRSVLLESAYFHEFALRHDVHDVVGLSLDIPGIPAHVRVALLYGDAPLSEGEVETMLRRLELVVPVLRTGLGLHLRYKRWLGAIPSMLDRVGERLILYSISGREVHRNVTMRRTLLEDPDQAKILETAEAVARAVLAHVHGNGGEPGSSFATPAASRQEIRTSMGRYRLRGCAVGPDTMAESAVLVSMDRLEVDPPSPDALRKRLGLTARESQVACLLVQRLTNDEIAAALGISSHTARHHTESVLLKVGVNSRRALRQVLTGDC